MSDVKIMDLIRNQHWHWLCWDWMKSMPPSGALGVTMDDDALIEAEIAQQLDQINLEADDFQFDENEVNFQDDDLDFSLEDQEVVIFRKRIGYSISEVRL